MIWGEENGVGVRSAVGMGSLPDNIPVEIEAVFKLSGETEKIVVTESVKEIRIENE